PNASEERSILVGQLERYSAGVNAFEEYLYGRKRQRFVRGDVLAIRRTVERRQSINVFPVRAQRFTARRQNVQTGSLLKKPLRQCGHLGDQVFGTIEYEKCSLSSDVSNE